MPKYKLGILINAKDNASRIMRGIGMSLQRLGIMAGVAAAAMVGLGAVMTRVFLKPAIEAERQQAVLKSILGDMAKAETVAKGISKMSIDFGLPKKDLMDSAAVWARMNKDVKDSVGETLGYTKAFAQFAAARPDMIPTAQINAIRSLMSGDMGRAEMLLDVPKEQIEEALKALGLWEKVKGEAAGAGEQALGRYTSVVKGAGAAGKLSAEELSALLDKLGYGKSLLEDLADTFAGKIGKLKARWAEFAESVGKKILGALIPHFDTLLTWLEKNEDTIVLLADKIGTVLAEAVETLFKWLTPERLDAIAKAFMGIVDAIIAWVDSGGMKRLIDGCKEWLKTLREIWEVIGPLVGAMGEVVMAPRSAIGKAGETLKMSAAVGAHGVGKLLGGQELANRWAGGVAGGGQQNVHVTFGVDPKDGTIQPYVANQVARNNAEMAEAMLRTTGGSRRTVGAGSLR